MDNNNNMNSAATFRNDIKKKAEPESLSIEERVAKLARPATNVVHHKIVAKTNTRADFAKVNVSIEPKVRANREEYQAAAADGYKGYYKD